jgi:hypothetical protein
LLRNIEHYSQLGDIVIQGDFNAYTNTVPDFVISNNTEFPRPIDNEYSIDSRNNLDNKPTNKSGILLIDLCKESGIRILNGRTIGDLRGKCTCVTYNGCSVVDYTLVSCNLLHGIGNYSDFLKRHLHLRNRLLDQGYKKIRLIRSLKKFIFRYQDLVAIYSVSAEKIINDGFSYSENV